MTIKYYKPEWMLKREAKKIAKTGEISHVSALNNIAIGHGFRDWQHLKLEGEHVHIEDVNGVVARKSDFH